MSCQPACIYRDRVGGKLPDEWGKDEDGAK